MNTSLSAELFLISSGLYFEIYSTLEGVKVEDSNKLSPFNIY